MRLNDESWGRQEGGWERKHYSTTKLTRGLIGRRSNGRQQAAHLRSSSPALMAVDDINAKNNFVAIHAVTLMHDARRTAGEGVVN